MVLLIENLGTTTIHTSHIQYYKPYIYNFWSKSVFNFKNTEKKKYLYRLIWQSDKSDRFIQINNKNRDVQMYY